MDTNTKLRASNAALERMTGSAYVLHGFVQRGVTGQNMTDVLNAVLDDIKNGEAIWSRQDYSYYDHLEDMSEPI